MEATEPSVEERILTREQLQQDRADTLVASWHKQDVAAEKAGKGRQSQLIGRLPSLISDTTQLLEKLDPNVQTATVISPAGIPPVAAWGLKHVKHTGYLQLFITREHSLVGYAWNRLYECATVQREELGWREVAAITSALLDQPKITATRVAKLAAQTYQEQE